MTRNPADQIDDFMWDFVKTGRQKSNPQRLKKAVYDLVQMMTQKTAGQRKNRKSDIKIEESLDMTIKEIVIEAACLVISGDIDKLIGKASGK